MGYLFKQLRKWIEYDPRQDGGRPFKPVRMTIRGAAGTGKTMLINILLAAVRNMFGINDVVLVGAPTGAAAFNI